MKVNITHSTEKRSRTLYYVNCRVNFSEEEKAVIRARTLGDHTVAFETGWLNMSPDAFTAIPTFLLDKGPRLFGVLAVVTFFVTPLITPFPFLVCLCACGYLWYSRRKAMKGLQATERTELKIKDIVGKPFNLSSASSAAIPPMEQEIADNLTYVKSLITATTVAPTEKVFEL
jgi:hypothetical protein